MRIESLLTEAEIVGEFQEALEARDLPEKFFYWTPNSIKAWRNFDAAPDFRELINSWTAISGRAADLIANFPGEVPVFSFGSGDGIRDRPVLRAINNANRNAKYFPVDASQTLLESACAGAEDEEIESLGVKADISSRIHLMLAADVAEAPRVFLVAGNTLGGFDPIDLMTNLADAMRPGDRLVIDGEIGTPAALELSESERASAFAFAPLASLGLSREDGRVRFEQRHDSRHDGLSMMTRHFLVDRDLRINSADCEVSLARGERILLNFRYLFDAPAFDWLLEHHGGLTIDEEFHSVDGRFITAICSK